MVMEEKGSGPRAEECVGHSSLGWVQESIGSWMQGANRMSIAMALQTRNGTRIMRNPEVRKAG